MSEWKVVALGGPGVGKTTLIRNYVNSGTDEIRPTTSCEVLSKTVDYQDQKCTLRLWDTVGQERFKSLGTLYIRDSKLAILLIDLSDKKSIEDAKYWVNAARAAVGDQYPIVLVGNKVDLEDKKEITFENISAFQEELSIPQYFEISAKTGLGVDSLFDYILSVLVTIPCSPPEPAIKLDAPNEKKSKCC